VNSDSNAHEHELRTLNNLALDSQQIGTLKSTEAEIGESVVATVDDSRVEVLKD
jgi:hypothetical protein